VIATDADREGENIAYTIIDQAGARDKVTKRLWINSNLPSAVAKGFKNLRDSAETYSYYKESHARSEADWLVGMNFTRFYTLKAQAAGIPRQVFSAGRVQTPVLALICRNALERKGFVPKPYFTIAANTEKEGVKVKFSNPTRYETDNQAQEVLNTNQIRNPYRATITQVVHEEKKTAAPELFDLAGIQSFANASWKYTNDKTLEIVQSLYDKQLVTYPRTEENKISEEEFNLIVKDAPALERLLALNASLINTAPRKKYVGAYKAHSALMPTAQHPNLAELSDEQRNIYRAIATRTLMMLVADYGYSHTEVKIMAGELELKVTGNIPTNQGWKGLQKDDQEKEEVGATGKQLPDYREGETVYLNFEVEKGMTKAPRPYTPASLGGKNSQMQKLNLGTSATRAGIIKTVVDRGYARLVKNIYEPTDKGMLMYGLVKDSAIGSPELTAKWEDRLHSIETQEEQPQVFLRDIRTYVTSELGREQQANFDSGLVAKAIESSSLGTCPKCGTGVIEAHKAGYFCSNQNCDFAIWAEIAHKRISQTIVKQLLTVGKTKNKVTGMKKRDGGTFSAYLILNAEKKLNLLSNNRKTAVVNFTAAVLHLKGGD
jgi:DNA topoisomerase-3